MRQGFLTRAGVQRLGWVGVLLLIWQMTAVSGVVSPLVLPRIEAVLGALWKALVRGELLAQTGYSLLMILGGMALSGVMAVLLAVVHLHVKPLAGLIDTLCMLAHPLPAIALLPLIFVWFGVGTPAVLVIIIHGVLWPVLLDLITGFRVIPKIYLESGRNLNLSPVSTLLHLYLPACAPYLLSGVRTGWGRAWRALISAEMVFGAIGSSGGIGWFIFKNRVFMDTPGLYAGILSVIVVSIGVESALTWIEKKTVTRYGVG